VNTVSTPITFAVRLTPNFNISVALPVGWDYFSLPKQVLENITSLGGNYSVENVLSSAWGNFTILYYYNGTSWKSYVPGRAVNDLTIFDDQSARPYWIRMNATSKLQIA
jgi:hypothetical protein